MIPFHGLHINGKSGPAADGASCELINPANAQPLASVAQGGLADVNRAVEAAHRAYVGAWSRFTSRDRGQALQRLSELVRQHGDQLATAESQNVGKPIGGARGEMGAVANCFEYYAGAVNKACGQTIPVAADGHCFTFREPLGVCALIVPWNFPLLITAWKLGPALAMGNTVVIKPAEATPLSALLLADLALEAGFPEGVINVVPGQGSVAGAALVGHRLVRKVSFTGSTTTGTKIMSQAANDMTRISLELGGKSANLVFGDADLDACLDSSLWSVFDNTGQDCCARSRILVQRAVFERFVEGFVNRTKAIRVGDPAEETTQMGPLYCAAHREQVVGYLALAEQEGGMLLCGGTAPDSGPLANGSYLTPAVYVGLDNTTRFMREEIFGPVVGIVQFDDESEAIRIANDSNYGLAASIWTRDVARALRVSRALEVGMLSVNSSSSVHIEAPFGGVKQSGMGREQGMAALDHFSQLKSVFIAGQ